MAGRSKDTHHEGGTSGSIVDSAKHAVGMDDHKTTTTHATTQETGEKKDSMLDTVKHAVGMDDGHKH